MAKKKKQTKKKVAPVEKVPSPVMGYVLAVVCVLSAVFIFIGGFHAGGSLPKGLFGAASWLFGWAAWLVPISLLYWGYYKFTNDDHRVPRGRVFSMYMFLILMSAWFFTAFARVEDEPGMASQTVGGNGGHLGNAVGDTMLAALDKVPASLLFFVFGLLTFFFAFGISPKILLNVGKLFRRREAPEGELAALKAKAVEGGFQLNEGVPVVKHSEANSAKEQAHHTTFRNTAAKKLSAEENHEALTTAGDPDWKFPGLDLLDQRQDKADAGNVEANARLIKETYANFSIDVEMEGANIGPRVTQYTLRPPTGVKLTKITALENNLALDLAATSIRMEAPIPGKRAVGIEVPNVKGATVRLSSILQSREWNSSSGPLTFAIGKDIVGHAVVADLARMPHLLVAGQTGSGKSVMINDILTSLLYRNTPSDLKLILVDPKQVELTPYNDIPHLLTPVIHEPEKCISALKWAVAEMERRLRTMAEEGKRNIEEYNKVKPDERMPYVVIVIDELSDLMMMAARDVEALIVRVAQKARAAGIHLILATQRPSVNVITGLIKANVPARVAFTTVSQVDSRTIIDQMGAEKLLGRGDMLYVTAEMPAPKRVQAAFVTERETGKVNDFIREQQAPDYNDEVVSQPVQIGKGGLVEPTGGGHDNADEDMFRDAVRVVVENRKASTSLLQRRLRIGYGRAARLMEEMEEQGIIGAADGSRPRDVLVSSLDQVFGGGEAGAAADGGDLDEYGVPVEPADRAN
ncbi:cell division protein FtsK [Candidatus Saccharibacteria bacterium]|nr:MAG: cell division protein FtsK [Candidatus Saccharibacteria bacterium]PID98911.1 MAG: cell division protein FtsK [Candidatus Saccharibacteria bacterium]